MQYFCNYFMPIILNIDTATNYGAVGLAHNGVLVAYKESESQKEHAAFLQPAIQEILAKANMKLQQLDAIAVSIGPGSYTGLRVSLASAKGLCYALNKPLIAVPTLQVIALSAINNNTHFGADSIVCAMIDARRMEVYTACYNFACQEVLPAEAVVLTANSFSEILTTNKVLFCGDGSIKTKELIQNTNAYCEPTTHTIAALAQLANKKYELAIFEDVAYCEPFYLKPFFTTAKI
jgi:tRNA threonylcarbamoyladenosine biosynthesis protein TsaB